MYTVGSKRFDSERQAKRFARGMALSLHESVAITRNGAVIARWFFHQSTIKLAVYEG